MGKRKREPHEEQQGNSGFFQHVDKIGLPEVDKIMEQGVHRFENSVPNATLFVAPLPKDNKDRLSKLGDNILQFIISILTMREGAATCILSRRWKNLWTQSVSSLHFNDFNVFGHHYPVMIFKDKEEQFFKNERRHNRTRLLLPLNRLLHFKRKRKGFLVVQRTMFIRRVNRILKLRRPCASTINEFHLSFPMGKESTSHVDKWMKLAAAQGVTKLQLNFNWTFFGLSYDPGMLYEFPFQQFGSSLTYLRLRCCTLQFPCEFQGLNSLVSLNLTQCFLTTDIVQTILSNCPSLEVLSLRKCIALYPTTLEFVGPLILLKHLDISDCLGVNEIKLQDVNLLSFELQGPRLECYQPRPLEIRLSIKNAPHLARLVLHTDPYGSVKGSVETLSNVPRLETLFLKHELTKLPNLSAFNNLKRLVFSAKCDISNLFEVLCLLEACPLLQQLHVDMGISSQRLCKLSESTKITTRSGCPHNNLKEVELYEFDSHSEQIELAKYLLKNAMVLENMKICTTCKSYRAQGIWTLSKRTTKPLQMSLHEVSELLQKEKRPSTKLVIVSP